MCPLGHRLQVMAAVRGTLKVMSRWSPDSQGRRGTATDWEAAWETARYLTTSPSLSPSALFLHHQPPPVGPQDDGEHLGVESWRCGEDMRVKSGGSCNFDFCGVCAVRT